jgi:glycosyltransferase involved in cell wall biosynthesis
MAAAPEISVVVPVYNCAGCLESLYGRLVASLDDIAGGFELILVDDRSPDGSWPILTELARRDERVRAARLSRNFGQHAAITAGFALARGRWVAVLDCDLQDPPEEVPRLYARAQEGYDIVFGRRRRPQAPLPRRLLSRLYFRMIRAFTGAEIDADYGTLSIVSREVRNEFLRITDRNRHYLFILHWLGFERSTIDYTVAERAAGTSAYTWRGLLRHAVQGIFFQTTALLRWVVYGGFGVALAGALSGVYLVASRVTGKAYPGWTSLMVMLLVIGGLVILTVGVIGLYVGEIFHEVRGRPLFVIDEETARADAPTSTHTT